MQSMEKSTVLVTVSYGRQWFVHCIYTVRSKENAGRGIGKRSIRESSVTNSHYSSYLNFDPDIGHNGRGTNMNRIVLDYSNWRRVRDSGIKPKQHHYPYPSSDSTAFIVVMGIVGSILIIAVTVLLLSRRKTESEPSVQAPTIVKSATGQTRVVANRHLCTSDDQTEV